MNCTLQAASELQEVHLSEDYVEAGLVSAVAFLYSMGEVMQLIGCTDTRIYSSKKRRRRAKLETQGRI